MSTHPIRHFIARVNGAKHVFSLADAQDVSFVFSPVYPANDLS
jgi:hypothetical protein